MLQYTLIVLLSIFYINIISINADRKVESDETIDSLLKSVSKEWRNSLVIEEIPIKFKNINITGWRNVYRSGPSIWMKNYEGPGNNWDYMNLTLSSDNMQVDIEELSFGEFKSHFWFDIKQNQVNISTSSQGYVSPGNCIINVDDIDIISFGGVIMHSDNEKFEGRDMSEAANACIPFLNKLAKSKLFESYLQNIIGKFCNLKITDANQIL